MLNEFCRFSFIVFFLRCLLIQSAAWNHIPASVIPIQFQFFLFPEDEISWRLKCLLSDRILLHILLSVFSWGLYIHHLQEVSLPLFSVKSSFRFAVSFFRIQILCIIPWTKTEPSTQSPAMTSFQVTTSSRKTAQGRNPTSVEKWIWGGEISVIFSFWPNITLNGF